MGKDLNLANAKKMGEAINSGKLDSLKEYFASDVKDHDPAPTQGKGPEGFIQFFTEFRSAFPDLKIAVEHIVADEDNVAFAYTVTGTQDGPFQGIPATGKKIKARGMQIGLYNKNGQIVERWGSSDEAGIMQQLGVEKPTTPLNEIPPFSMPASTGKI